MASLPQITSGKPASISPPASQELRGQILRLLGYILRRPVSENENPSRSREPEWDSLKHVEFMFLLEDHFGIRFSEGEMAEIEDAGSILQILERRARAVSNGGAEHAP